MKRFTEYLLVSSLLLGGVGTAAAQDQPQGTMPPKVLNIAREFVKPGKAGASHEKTESAFVQAMRGAKWPTHYLAVDSLSGKSRSLFITAYDSFEAMEKDTMAEQKNAVLAAALDRAGVADGELLSETDAGDFAFREEYSLRPKSDIPHMRYFEITVFHVRQGHDKDWDSLVKMYMAAYEKIPDVHWVTYEAIYGQDAGTFIVFNPMKSASEIDRGLGEGKQFEAAMGEEGMRKLNELTAAAVESSQTNLFIFNPRESYVSDDWVKADPDFWRPKTAQAAGAKKSEKKPAAKK